MEIIIIVIIIKISLSWRHTTIKGQGKSRQRERGIYRTAASRWRCEDTETSRAWKAISRRTWLIDWGWQLNCSELFRTRILLKSQEEQQWERRKMTHNFWTPWGYQQEKHLLWSKRLKGDTIWFITFPYAFSYHHLGLFHPTCLLVH